MRKSAYLRNELNLTQYEMAELLNITRSQLSLFELGLRELPTNALIRSSQIGLFMATSKTPEAKDFPQIADWEEEKEKFLAKALKDCEHYQSIIIRKLPKMEEEYRATLNLLQLIIFFKEQANKEDALRPAALLTLEDKAMKSLERCGPKEVVRQKYQLLILQQQEEILKKLIESNRVDKQELE
ncbi:helix-turn-helix domain-containing protein [Flavobacterium sp. 102]|uniref:helix-turn-helix domain-containing protein n=1 Tax=Flavobacterium sp. 102 TaxID=2135623 RepID=UPI000F1FDD23|nr:helix-turn-helix transcriptional regulator [Flavobacterium sp. 102]RKS02585.1 helix-turn-helix protein [Flavobacterium sp. 102]